MGATGTLRAAMDGCDGDTEGGQGWARRGHKGAAKLGCDWNKGKSGQGGARRGHKGAAKLGCDWNKGEGRTGMGATRTKRQIGDVRIGLVPVGWEKWLS